MSGPESQPLTPDPPRPPGTPEPPNLDVDVDKIVERVERGDVPVAQDVTPGASTPEPTD